MASVQRPSASNQLIFTDTVDTNFVPKQIHFDWVRWCYASINKHFDDRRNGYELYIEGDERIQEDLNEFAELRIDGPFIFIPQKGLYFIDIEINVLCQTHNDPRRFYKPQRIVGTFARAFENLIRVEKLGDGPFDDGSLIDCFHLQRDVREGVEINYYGIIRQDMRLMQTTIEGHYRLEIWSQE